MPDTELHSFTGWIDIELSMPKDTEMSVLGLTKLRNRALLDGMSIWSQ